MWEEWTDWCIGQCKAKFDHVKAFSFIIDEEMSMCPADCTYYRTHLSQNCLPDNDRFLGEIG